MHAAAGQILDPFDRVAIVGVDQIGGAQLGRQLQFHRVGVDGDDARRAGDIGAVDGGHADAAAADHRDGLAGGDLGGVGHRAEAGHHPAADTGGAIQRHVLADFDHRVLMDQHLFAKAERFMPVCNRCGLSQVRRSDWPGNNLTSVLGRSPAGRRCGSRKSRKTPTNG